MGLLAIHAGYADHFFPGTSVLQKRARYVFFTCWNYLRLDELEEPSTKARKEAAEEWVRDQLVSTNQRGIIGLRVKRPAQPVDFIYWTALRTWGFYRGPDRSTLHSGRNSLRPRRVQSFQGEDDRLPDDTPAAFLVPEPPHYWLRPRPRVSITFDLTHEEAQFLQTRLESLPACVLSKAAGLARQREPAADAPWEDVLIHEAASERREEDMLERARLASGFAKLVRGIYGALVERRRNDTWTRSQLSAIKDSDHYRTQLRSLFVGREDIRRDIRVLDLVLLEADLPHAPKDLLQLLRHLQQRVQRIGTLADVDALLLDDTTLDMFCSIEQRRKQRRARLPDTAFGAERRADFQEGTVNVVGIDYRWGAVRMLLHDLHAGLRGRA